MIHDIIFLILGLALLVVGANYVTDGAVAVARRFKVSNLMIGLTVVALGSTLPDIVVCVESAFQDKPALAMGEVIGANIFDLLLVVGIMGILRPMKVSGLMRRQDLPILFIASAALWIAGDSILFDHATHNVINRSSGLMLIVIFVFYMWFMILTTGKSGDPDDEGEDETTATSTPAADKTENTGIVAAHSARAELRVLKSKMSELKGKQWFSWILIVIGLGALVIGGNWEVDGASGLALKIGMSQAMVALTVVAIGNALPDLVTSVTATVKGASGLALGNIVGSCVINALLTIGLSSLVIPLRADSIGFVDFITLVGAAALLWIVPSVLKSKSIGRVFGVILVLLYVAYMVFTVIRG
ncbi:MAG: sodium:calcium antiporter [Muribaculaceae bacterium]|nr:sodium:calcium antiporter [Muribaculaceae bacterium]